MSQFKQLGGSLSYHCRLGLRLLNSGSHRTKGIAVEMLEIVFWTLVVLVGYVYFGYPALLLLLSRGARKAPVYDETAKPHVTLLISAFNEADCIAEKLDNSLELDYPKELLEIVVISDASDDGTDEIVGGYADRGVRLLRMEDRGGKTLGLNAGVEEASGEIIVFSDANAMYREDAIRALVGPFSEDSIGAVIGEQAYHATENEAGKSESLYWRYETAIKELESHKGSVVGGDGAIYAVRKNLFKPMRADALSDFINPLQVVRLGYRVIYNRQALAYEATAESFEKEYRRKVRIVNRAWRATWSMAELLNPFRHGVFALKLWSHKMLRWLVPFFLALALVLNILLLSSGWIYFLTLWAQIGMYGLALLGRLLKNRFATPKIISVPYYFCLVNIASAQGILEAFKGETYTTWSTARADRAQNG